MLFSLLLAIVLQDDRVVTTLPTQDSSPRLFVSQRKANLDPVFIDPLHEWQFPHFAEGIAGSPGSVVSPRARFSVYAQSRVSRDLMLPVTRTLVRAWDESVTRLNIDHQSKHGLMVHVFICDGGKAGGEQLVIKSRSRRDNFQTYNAIYLYHAEGLTDPIEAVREVAHEYGHAILPPIGGFREPEDWANGALGERLFMRYLYRSYVDGKISGEDVFGASREALKGWLSVNADPLAATVARRRIDQTALAGVGPVATNEYLGLMLMVDDLFPDLVGRALKLSGGQTAIDALKGVVEAVNEQKGWVMDVPSNYGNEIWVPIAGKVTWSGATQLQTLGAWTKVRINSRKISARRV